VPPLEHNNDIRGESLDLIKYIDRNFDGPALLLEVRLNPCNTCNNAVLFWLTKRL
jgi:hypothetical protein